MQLTIKEKLHQYVELGDERLLKIMLAVANEYTEDDAIDFTEADIKEFERRTQERKKGNSVSRSWEVAKQMISTSN